MIEVLKDLPWEDLRTAFDALVSSGRTPQQAARQVAKAVDAAIPFDQLVSGAAGQVLEALDGPAVQLMVTLALQYTTRGKVVTQAPVSPTAPTVPPVNPYRP